MQKTLSTINHQLKEPEAGLRKDSSYDIYSIVFFTIVVLYLQAHAASQNYPNKQKQQFYISLPALLYKELMIYIFCQVLSMWFPSSLLLPPGSDRMTITLSKITDLSDFEPWWKHLG